MSEEIKSTNGKISVTVKTQIYGEPLWSFCQNGFQSSGVHVSKEQFEMMRDLVTNPTVVAIYEGIE